MKSMADGLPPEIAAQVHPDWRKNESAYWANREAIRAQYEGLWVAYANGRRDRIGHEPCRSLSCRHGLQNCTRSLSGSVQKANQ